MDIQRLKLKLGLTEDSSEDMLLTVLLSDAASYISIYLEGNEIPANLEYIAEEVAIKRYRRIGAEGITIEKIDVLSTTYITDDFKEYLSILDLYKKNNIHSKSRKLRML
jgi:hypothetical protein